MSVRAEISGKVDLFNLHCAAPEEFPFLLQSVAGHVGAGRYDILFGHPQTIIQSNDSSNFFDELSMAVSAQQGDADEAGLPFCGGWFFVLGYEAARYSEPLLKLPPSPYAWPDALAVRCTAAFVYDHEQQVCHLVAEAGNDQLSQLRSLLINNINNESQNIDNNIILSISEEAGERYMAGVERLHDYLLAGDTYQVNLSRRWRAQLRSGISYQHLYRRLRQHNPAPFSGLAVWNQSAVLSSSPERLVRVARGIAETRPIAGTRPRSADARLDAHLLEQLRSNLKERAEHVMLIDLERNDLGRVCEQGSIEVNELMVTESYAHVHHIVSNVRGTLRKGMGCAQALRAIFPGGTITGCPKFRSMELIAELEQEGRGPYTGSMGYISNCGRMDSNILIRSLVCEKDTVSFRTGAGIVADSVAISELMETRAKAKGLLLTLGAPT